MVVVAQAAAGSALLPGAAAAAGHRQASQAQGWLRVKGQPAAGAGLAASQAHLGCAAVGEQRRAQRHQRKAPPAEQAEAGSVCVPKFTAW